MSETNTAATPEVDATNEPTSEPIETNNTDSDDMSPSEARALVEKAESEGKTVKQLLDERNSTPEKKTTPKEVKKPEVVETKEKTESAAKKYKVKVDGAELEVDEQELLRGYTHNKAANKAFQDGRKARQQAEEFLTMMRDPDKLEEILEKLGHKPRELFEQRLVKQLEDEMLSPQEKELREARKKLKAIDDMEKAQQKAIEDSRAEEMKQKFVKDYEEQFKDALSKTEVPATKHTVARMAKYISQSAKIGFKMTPIEAAQLVKEDIKQEQLSLIANADGELLLKLLGDETASKILQARGKKVAKAVDYNKHIEKGDPSLLQRNSGNKKSPSGWRKFNT